MEMLGWRLCYGSSTSYLMTWLWIPHASSWSSTYECVGLLRTFHPLLTSRFTFQHLPAFAFCLFCAVVWFCCFGVFLFPVFALLCFWFLFCKCLGIPNSPRSLDLDDRQGLIARSAMQQKKIDTSLRTWWRLRPRSTRDSNTLLLCSAASSKILPTLLYIQS